MKKTHVLFAVIGLMVLAWASQAAARPEERYDPGTGTTRYMELKNRRAGYKIFRNVCKSCHRRGNKDAPFLHTESKTMQGWNNVFYKKYPQCARKGYWDKLTSEDLQNLNDYLYYNALDAYDPYDPWDNDGFRLFF